MMRHTLSNRLGSTHLCRVLNENLLDLTPASSPNAKGLVKLFLKVLYLCVSVLSQTLRLRNYNLMSLQEDLFILLTCDFLLGILKFLAYSICLGTEDLQIPMMSSPGSGEIGG
jgi:hypothetical protein